MKIFSGIFSDSTICGLEFMKKAILNFLKLLVFWSLSAIFGKQC